MNFIIKENSNEFTPYKIISKTNQNVDLEFFMTSGGECDEIHIDGFDYRSTNDTMDGIWVAFGQIFYTISDVRKMAEGAFQALLDEFLKDQSESSENDDFLSCPRKTGRI